MHARLRGTSSCKGSMSHSQDVQWMRSGATCKCCLPSSFTKERNGWPIPSKSSCMRGCAWVGVSSCSGSMSSVRILCSGAECGCVVMRRVGSVAGSARISRPLPAHPTLCCITQH